MTERPIIMSASSVRAVLAGTKTQTRRIVKPQPKHLCFGAGGRPLNCDDGIEEIPCPYGVPGDLLYVKETWKPVGREEHFLGERACLYRASIDEARRDFTFINRHNVDEITVPVGRWRSPLFMPRWASRITLGVESVRVERLQEIRREDALAEGIQRQFISNLVGDHYHWGDPTKDRCSSAITAYRALWDSLNAKRAPWESNPWVWRIEFRRIAP